MAIDRRNLQVLANYCSAAADAMAYTLMRTAHSTFVKETEDFSCAIVTDTGLCFANPRSYGAPWYSGIDYGPVLRMIDDYEEGDICITNDSYSGNVATHSPDLHIWKRSSTKASWPASWSAISITPTSAARCRPRCRARSRRLCKKACACRR